MAVTYEITTDGWCAFVVSVAVDLRRGCLAVSLFFRRKLHHTPSIIKDVSRMPHGRRCTQRPPMPRPMRTALLAFNTPCIDGHLHNNRNCRCTSIHPKSPFFFPETDGSRSARGIRLDQSTFHHIHNIVRGTGNTQTQRTPTAASLPAAGDWILR